jgi:hypothetical protein
VVSWFVYHGKDEIPTIDDQNVNTVNLTGIRLAKYVLQRITNDHDKIEIIAKELDNDERFTLGIINFLLDVDWVKQDSNGAYIITSNGKTSTIE